MTTTIDGIAVQCNAAFHSVGDKVEHLLGQALQLKPADPKHIAIAMEMASSLSDVFTRHTYSATSVPPMVLSAAAELQEHLDSSFCNVVSTPVWSNIRPDDPWCRNSPLYPLTVAYGIPPPPTNPPVAGPSGSNAALAPDVLAGKGKGKERADPEGEPAEQRGCGIEQSKRPRVMSTTRSQSRAPKSKWQRATSKAMITSEDEQTGASCQEEDFLPPSKIPSYTASQVSGLNMVTDDEGLQATPNPRSKTKQYVEIDELDDEMPMNVGPAPKMGRPYVEIPPTPSAIAGPVAADDQATDLMVWSPGCGPCVHRGLVCRQGFNNSSAALTICGSCHRLKHKCGGNGSAAPTTKGRKPAATTTRRARSRSHRRPSPVHVSPETDDTAAPAAASTSAPSPLPLPLPLPPPLPSPLPSPLRPATTAPASSPDGPADESVLALKEQVEALQSTVASLEAKASIGEKHLLEANQRLADQEATSKLLAKQFEELRRQLLPPPVPASPQKMELTAESASGDVAGLSGNNMDVEEDLAEAASASGGNNMDVAEAPAESTPASGVNAGLSGNTKDVAEAESASIASSRRSEMCIGLCIALL
ncbi:hypothetical protein DFH29DRAFT_1007066 [Suillus ampliporus]|nr:hypothetical protein DFH29DRAFT_1007066 [Suillus ampliporus]